MPPLANASLADERASWAVPRAPYRLVFYDNARYPVSPENGLPVAVWEHPDFSPLVAVDANLWVGVSVFRAASAESALADRIYANVQLKLIVDEYERLQQRAREVLEGLGLHPLTVNLAGAPAGGTPLGGPGPKPNDAPPGREPVETALARLRAVYRQAASEQHAPAFGEGGSLAGIFLAMTGSPSEGPPAGGGSPEGASSGPGAVASGRSPFGSASGGDFSGNAGMASSGRDSVPEPGLVPPDLGRDIGMARSFLEDQPLPWVLRAALAAVRFLFTHKVEVLAALLFFFAVFWIVAAIVTQKRRRRM